MIHDVHDAAALLLDLTDCRVELGHDRANLFDDLTRFFLHSLSDLAGLAVHLGRRRQHVADLLFGLFGVLTERSGFVRKSCAGSANRGKAFLRLRVSMVFHLTRNLADAVGNAGPRFAPLLPLFRLARA